MGFEQATAIQTSQTFTSSKRSTSAMKIVAFTFLAVYIAVIDAVSVTSRLQVNIPQSLSKADGYDHRDALFGIPPYGGSIQQQVYYANSSLCNANVDNRRGYPERETDKNGEMLPWQSPFILLVDRGGCTFVQKVRNAQRAGAAAVLIADTTCMCSDIACLNGTQFATCQSTEPIMADDGSGSDISIPSFLIFKMDADSIKAVLMSNHQVRVEMKFSVPAPDNRVEYELWSTPLDAVSRGFIQDFKAAAVALGADAFFTPHMYVLDGARAGCQSADGENECMNLCTNNGKYCSTDPDDDIMSGSSGADVVTESLRRLCIWDVYGSSDGIGVQWWDYVNAFVEQCDTTGLFHSQECIDSSMTKANVDKAQVEQCMKKSGGLEGKTNNTFFEQQLSDGETQGVFLIPSLYINQAPVRGELGFATAFKAICAGFAPGYEPKICLECSSCHDEKGCVVRGSCPGGGLLEGGVSIQVFALSFLGLTLLFVIIGYVVHQRQQRIMREQVRGIVMQYMPLDENRAHADTSLGIDEDDQPEFTIS